MSMAKPFRQLTRAEKEKIAQARELYKNFLDEDEDTKGILDKIYGAGKWHALFDAQRRALWRTGREMKWEGLGSHRQRHVLHGVGVSSSPLIPPPFLRSHGKM